MKILLSTLLLLGTLAAASAAPEIGQPAPAFTLKDSTGQEHKLSDYKGKFVVLEWTNFGCPFVHKHYDSHNMQNLQKEYTDKGVVWLTICSSGPGKEGNVPPDQIEANRKSERAASTAYLIDEDGTVGQLYQARTTPDMFVITPDGTLVYKGAIDNQPTPDPASLQGATNYVKNALDETMAGKPVTTASTKSYGCSVKY